MSKVTKKEVESFFAQNPEYANRSMKYMAIEKVTGIPADVCQKICVWNRRIQDILPPDEKGYALAAQYLFDNGYVSKETVREGQVFCRGQWYSVR